MEWLQRVILRLETLTDWTIIYSDGNGGDDGVDDSDSSDTEPGCRFCFCHLV